MPYKVLIVDDDPDTVHILELVLKDRGYEVVSANSGEAALKKIADAKPDLVILDVMMPGIDGYKVCEKIKTDESTSSIPVIMLTAKDMGEDVDMALSKKADWYIAKPFDYKYLLNKVDGFIKKKLD